MAARVPQLGRIDRDRLCPANDRYLGENPDDWQNYRPQGIDVGYRIQGKAPGSLRCVVAKRERDNTMAHLVENDRDYKAGIEQNVVRDAPLPLELTSFRGAVDAQPCGRLGLQARCRYARTA